MFKEQNGLPESRLVPRLLAGLTALVVRYPWPVLSILALFCGFSIYFACTRLAFLTQRNDLVNPNKSFQVRWRQHVREFGDDDDIVVVVRGKDRLQMRAAIEAVADKLRQRPDIFDRIFYKVDLRPLRNRALLYLPTDQIRQIQQSLKSMNLLLEAPLVSSFDPLFSWKSLTVSQLLGEAERRTWSIRTPNDLAPADAQFFEQLRVLCDSAAAVLSDPGDYRNPWKSILPRKKNQPDPMSKPQYFFSAKGELAFLLVRPAKDLSSFTSAEAGINEMRNLLAGMRKEYDGLEFGLTGLPVLEHDEMSASRTDTLTASVIALAGVALLFLLVYRCLRYPLLTLSTLLVGMVLTLGWVTVTIGHLNMLSATFAVMLIGLGDYGVLWITRYEQERAGGREMLSAVQTTTRLVGPGIVTAAVTTALAFFTALFVDFRAVSELGWIAGSGVLFCALSCFTFLPAIVRLTERQQPQTQPLLRFSPPAPSWMPVLNRYPRLIFTGAVIAAAVGGFFALRVPYDANLLNLQSRQLESVKWELALIEKTAGASWHALSSTTTPEEASALKARYEKLPAVGRVVEVASLIPVEQELKLELIKDIHHRLRLLPKKGIEIPHVRPNAGHLREQLDGLLAELQPLAQSQIGAIYNLRCSLQNLLGRMKKLKPEVAAGRLQHFEQRLTRDLADNLHALRDVSTPKHITCADLPQSLRARHIGKTGKWLLRIFGKGSLWEFQPLERFVAQVRQVDAEVTGKPVLTYEGLKTVRNGFKWACIYAVLAMVVVLVIDFRNVWYAALALAPLAIGMVLTLGILGLFRLPLNPANLIALPLILGIGADHGVHIVHDYLSRRKTGRYALGRATGRGILVAALTTILGFGTLMISHHRGLASLGLLLTIGVGTCLATALVFLPALLRVVTKRDAHSQSRSAPRAA